jgi:hypothetical protein
MTFNFSINDKQKLHLNNQWDKPLPLSRVTLYLPFKTQTKKNRPKTWNLETSTRRFYSKSLRMVLFSFKFFGFGAKFVFQLWAKNAPEEQVSLPNNPVGLLRLEDQFMSEEDMLADRGYRSKANGVQRV